MSLPFLGYLMLSLFAGLILTVGVSMFRPTKTLDDFKAWKWILGMAAFAGLAPYMWIELQTRRSGPMFQPHVKRALGAAGVEGPMLYYKVMSLDEKKGKAQCVAVAREKSRFGDSEKTVILVDLVSEDGKWRPDRFNIIDSYKRNKDGATFPPYW